MQVEFIKIHSLCRQSCIYLAFSFWKKLAVVTLHNLKVQSFLKANFTWWPIAKTDLLEDHEFESISRFSKLISNTQFLII